jgi:phospholipid transport system substrate-binding protein
MRVVGRWGMIFACVSWWLPPTTTRALAAPGAGSPDPMEQLRATDATVAGVLSRRVPDWSPEADAVRWRLDVVLRETLDHEAIARGALAADWDKLSEVQRRTFLQTFSALIDRAFVSAVTRPGVRRTFDSETVLGPTASVMLTASAAGALPDATGQKMEYRLAKKRGRWLIYDLVVDRSSLIDHYRVEFARIMQRGGPDELIARLQRKLEDSRRSPPSD